MFNSLDRIARLATPHEMENPTPVLPETPAIAPENKKTSLNPHDTMLPSLILPKSGSESESSSSGTTAFVPVTAAEILAQSSPTFDTTIKATTNPSLLPSHPSSTTPSTPSTAPTSSAAFDMAQKKQMDAEEAEKKAWMARYQEAQPCRMLLKTTDPEYLEIMRVWRAEQRRLGIEKKKAAENVIAGADDGGKGGKKKEKKAKWWHF